MDASYKIQRGIHVHLIQFFMCPEFWVHITMRLRFSHEEYYPFLLHSDGKCNIMGIQSRYRINKKVHTMKNLHLLKRLSALVLCVGAVGTTALAANTVTKTIYATYRGIRIMVDGTVITPKDSKGNPVEPFISNGTTYVPLRAVSEALGKQVTWDGDANMIYIGEKPAADGTYLLPSQTLSARVYGENDSKVKLYGGTTAKTAVYFTDDGEVYALYDLGGKYKTISFDAAISDYNISLGAERTSFVVYVDGVQKTEIPRTYSMEPYHVELDVTGAQTVKIVKTYYSFMNTEDSYIIADFVAK